jgi:hypothetical protein
MIGRTGSLRLYVSGGPGSGKTTLSKRAADLLQVPVHDLDGIFLGLAAKGEQFEAIFDEVAKIAATEDWIAEGSYLGWTRPLLERAEFVVLLEVPWRVASYRVLTRHFRRSIARNNPYPGWRRLYRFWRWSARYYGNRNDPGLDTFGVPGTHATRIQLLRPFAAKLVVCRTKSETEELLASGFSRPITAAK